jgi:hypothetical protein
MSSGFEVFCLSTITPSTLRNAQLFLVLGNKMKLRALLTRFVAACEAQQKQDALAHLRDTTLQFESELSGADRSSVAALQQNDEKRRREALMGLLFIYPYAQSPGQRGGSKA